MEQLINRFTDTPSEQNAYSIVQTLRSQNNHNTAILIGSYLSKLYPESIKIRSETAVSAYYAKQHQLSYELFSTNIKYNNLTEQDLSSLKHNRHFSITHIADNYINYNQQIVDSIVARPKKYIPLITFTITTCKRFDLFEKTINSFLNCCTDLDRIDEWFCVDDNSSKEDKEKMKEKYPFFTFYWKTKDEKGHPQSMNIIRDHVKTEYIFHMEDDWKFFYPNNYISNCMDVLLTDNMIGQCLINKNYAETGDDINILGGSLSHTKKGTCFYIHEYTPDTESKKQFLKKYGAGKSCAYWPHFSFRPSLLKRSVLLAIGKYNEGISHFEMDYSHRYVSKGFKSVFLDGIYCLHIGRLTSQREDKRIPNAYELNGEAQFSGKEKQKKRFSLGSNVKTYVVNMDSRPDRMKSFEKTSPINYERFSAVN